MVLDRIKSAGLKLLGRQAMPSGPSGPSASYMRSQQVGAAIFSTMAPRLRDSEENVRDAWVDAASRAIDVIHNNGWISGVVDALMALMIGDGLRPNLKPDLTMFGFDAKQTAAWAALAESRFTVYSSKPYNVDAAGRYNLAQIQAAAVRQWFATGEVVSEFPLVERAGSPWKTKIRMIESHRLSQKSEITRNLKQGVFNDGNGAPVGYLFERKGEYGQTTEIAKGAYDAYGRAKVAHVFDGQIGQNRGITPLAPVLRVLRDYDQLSNATLVASMIHAIFAATVESDYPTTEVLDALKDQDEQDQVMSDAGSRFDAFMGEKIGWHKNVNIDLGRHGKIAHLMMGERLNLHSSKSPNANYEAFANFLLREIARCVGALLPDLTGDHRGESYSSIKMGIAKQWPLLLYRRKIIPTPISQCLLENFLEEEVDSGALPLPGGIDGFVKYRDQICRADWRGPAKPVADEVKAATAHEKYRNMGVISDEMICNDLGADHEDIYRQRAAEKDMREDLGIHGGITNGGTDVDDMEEIANAAIENKSAEGAGNAK